MKLSLAQKLVLVIEVAVVLVVVFGGVAAYLIFQKSLIARIGGQLESVAVLKEHSIKRFIREVTQKVEYLAQGEHTRKHLVAYVLDTNDTNKKALLTDVNRVLEEHSSLSDIFVMDTEGEIIVSTNPTDEGKIKSTESYFLNAHDKTVVQDYFYDVTIAAPTLMIATPLKSDGGEFLGVLVGRVYIEEIGKLMMERSGLGETGETFIVNSSNIVVTELLKEPGAALKKTLYLPQITACLSGKSNFEAKQDYHGEQILGYWRWLPELKSCLVTKIDRSEALAPIIQAAIILAGVVLIIGVFMGIFGYYMGWFMMKPLSKLREEVQKMKNGNFEVDIDIDSTDEIGEVAVAFNQMAIALKEMYSGLEDTVKKKTSELLSKNSTLESSKSAMMNLLEDARNLENQLALEKKGVEKKVEERTGELVAVINSIDRGLMVVDKNLKVILINKAITHMIHNAAVVDFITLKEFLKCEIDIEQLVQTVFLTKESTKLEPKLFDTIYLSLKVIPVVDYNKVDEVAIFIKDVTEAMMVQRSRDEFFSIASHELRTPLTAIRGNTEMILDNYLEKIQDKDIVEMLEDIHEGSVRLIGIVNDFLNVSRLEMGKIEFKPTSWSVEEVVLDTLKNYQVTGSRQKLSLVWKKPEHVLPQVYADCGRVKEILINLIGNAIKHTTDGEVSVSALVRGNMLVLEIQDTGEGIKKELQGLLFRKFQQAGSSLYTRDTSKGTGLGLYISHLLVEGMGGKIWLESSEPGKGSIFAFSLPVSKEM